MRARLLEEITALLDQQASFLAAPGAQVQAPRAAQPPLPTGSAPACSRALQGGRCAHGHALHGNCLILSPPLETKPAQEARELVRAPSGCVQELLRKPSPFLTFPELPGAAGPVQHPALRGARAMSTAAEGDLQIMLGAQGSKDAISRKVRLFLSFQPSLAYFLSLSFC